MECIDCNYRYCIDLKFCSACGSELEAVSQSIKQDEKLLATAISNIDLLNVILHYGSFDKPIFEDIVHTRKILYNRTLILHNQDKVIKRIGGGMAGPVQFGENIRIPPSIGGKSVGTVILPVYIGDSIDLSYYANVDNIFINPINQFTKEHMTDKHTLDKQNSEAIITGFKDKLFTRMNDNYFEIIYSHSAYKVKIKNKICASGGMMSRGGEYENEYPALEVKSIIRFHKPDTKICIINQDQYDKIIRAL